ncbi:21124_t:CDS:2, partial [Gigaspora rosea]
ASLIASWIDKKQGMQYRFKDIPFEFKLIYQASRENFSVNKFHMNCDFKGPTIVTIKIRNSNEIIGGYNPLDWGENNENNDYDFKKSSKSFIFSLFSLNNGAIPRLSSISYQKEAIVWSSARGPCFGFKDLWIENNSSQRSALGISEQLSYETGIINKHVFEIEEYEVFQVIHKESSFKEDTRIGSTLPIYYIYRALYQDFTPILLKVEIRVLC